MTQFLPPNLLALFAPREPIPFLPPLDKLPHEKTSVPYGGVSQYLQEFEDPKDTPPPTRVETRDERKERKRKERAEQVAYKLEQDLALWDPHNNPGHTEDAFKTLFVARINYDTSESKLRREFEVYGPIRKIRLVTDSQTGKPRGYAFIEYEHERDMHSAYKHADGKKLDGRRVLVDVERSRTVKGWRPRRLGGGLGGTRKGPAEENTRFAGREREEPEQEERLLRRSRSLSKDRMGAARKRRSRSRDRPRRSRSRERDRRRRSKSKEEAVDRRRSRSKDRKRPRRSRSRDKKRSRSRDRKRSRRSRSRDRRKGPELVPEDGLVKTEPPEGQFNSGHEQQDGLDYSKAHLEPNDRGDGIIAGGEARADPYYDGEPEYENKKIESGEIAEDGVYSGSYQEAQQQYTEYESGSPGDGAHIDPQSY